MGDINLFEESGFQEAAGPKEVTVAKSKPRKAKTSKKRKKKRFSADELIAAVVLIGIGAAVVWLFSLRWTVKTQVDELTPQEYRAEKELGFDR